MLDGRDQKPLDRPARPAPKARRQRQRVGFGSRGGENHVPRQRADGGRKQGPRVFDKPSRLAPLGMNRGGIADELVGCEHRASGLGAKRRGRIPVEINTAWHDVLYYHSSRTASPALVPDMGPQAALGNLDSQ